MSIHATPLAVRQFMTRSSELTADYKRADRGTVRLDGAEDEPLGDEVEGRDAEGHNAQVVQTLVGDVVRGKKADRGSHSSPGAEETASEGRH